MNITTVRVVGPSSRRLAFSSDYKKNSFLFTKDRQIVARVYELTGRWYVWYESVKKRFPVTNFTEAISILEKDFS